MGLRITLLGEALDELVTERSDDDSRDDRRKHRQDSSQHVKSRSSDRRSSAGYGRSDGAESISATFQGNPSPLIP